VCERHLETILKLKGTPFTFTQIQDALKLCEQILFQDQKTKRLFVMQRNKSAQAKMIDKAVQLLVHSQTRKIALPFSNGVPLPKPPLT
jgi:sulfur relay (sulfurtransferase) complex TusBCD TusD component (DsrE family)